MVLEVIVCMYILGVFYFYLLKIIFDVEENYWVGLEVGVSFYMVFRFFSIIIEYMCYVSSCLFWLVFRVFLYLMWRVEYLFMVWSIVVIVELFEFLVIGSGL